MFFLFFLLVVEHKNHTKNREEEKKNALVIVQGQLMDPVRTCAYILRVKKKTIVKRIEKDLIAAFLFFFTLSSSVERERRNLVRAYNARPLDQLNLFFRSFVRSSQTARQTHNR